MSQRWLAVQRLALQEPSRMQMMHTLVVVVVAVGRVVAEEAYRVSIRLFQVRLLVSLRPG